MGGVETYVRKLIQYLPPLAPSVRFVLLCDDANGEYFSQLANGWELMVINNRRGSFGRLLRSTVRRCAGVDLLRLRLDRLGLDLIHHPVSIMSPPELTTPGVVTFHDMQHEFFPQFFSEKERRMRTERFRGSTAAARKVIAISEHARGCLVDRYGAASGEIRVIYQGCDGEFHPLDEGQLESGRSRLGLPRQFIYYPAATWPHKNHRTLLAAVQLLVERYQFNGQLVLTGIEKSPHEELLRDIDSRGLGDVVRIFGYLPYNDLPYLYNLAALMVFPSLFEGFGIPVLEAMACGCPVVCSNATSLPEVVGSAGLIFDPASAEDMAAKIFAVWSDAALRNRLRSDGISRAQGFDWLKTAQQTLEVYREVHLPRT
jgi:glycosyltransferase involved in cell wall biosynthesis